MSSKRAKELEETVRRIRAFAHERAHLDWEEHGDDFRKIVEMCDEAVPNEGLGPKEGG